MSENEEKVSVEISIDTITRDLDRFLLLSNKSDVVVLEAYKSIATISNKNSKIFFQISKPANSFYNTYDNAKYESIIYILQNYFNEGIKIIGEGD